MSENREDFNKMLEEYKAMTETSKPELGMKWFKFLIYFLLIFSAIEDLCQSLVLFFNYKNEFVDFEYYFYGNMRWLGIFFAIVWLIIAGYGIYIRFCLAGFKKNAPKKYIIFEIVNQSVLLLFTVAGEYALAETSDMHLIIASLVGGVIGCIIGGVIFIYPSIIYFKKRDHLFIN